MNLLKLCQACLGVWNFLKSRVFLSPRDANDLGSRHVLIHWEGSASYPKAHLVAVWHID